MKHNRLALALVLALLAGCASPTLAPPTPLVVEERPTAVPTAIIEDYPSGIQYD